TRWREEGELLPDTTIPPRSCSCLTRSGRRRLLMVGSATSPSPLLLNRTTLACHPEQSEGSQPQILRYAQNDNTDWSHRKVYECPVVCSEKEPRGLPTQPQPPPQS